MTLHKVWEITDYNCRVFAEVRNEDEECCEINEYTGDDQYRFGSSKVFSIRSEYLPEVGNVIMCLL